MGLKILPSKSGEILLEIIMRRYENRSTVMTSNRPIEEWGKLLSDVPAASAILDRLRLTELGNLQNATLRSHRGAPDFTFNGCGQVRPRMAPSVHTIRFHSRTSLAQVTYSG
jgi:hypothetical protein